MYNFVCVVLTKRVVLITLVGEIRRHRNDRHYYYYYYYYCCCCCYQLTARK